MADIVDALDDLNVIVTPDDPTDIVIAGVSESTQIAITIPGIQGPRGLPGLDSTVPGPMGPMGEGMLTRLVTYIQAMPSDEWHIIHDFPIRRPDVSVFDNNEEEIFADVSYPEPHLVVIKFANLMTGMVQLG